MNSTNENDGNMGTGFRVLAIDDDEFQLKSMVRSLRQYGYEVTTSQRGEEAMDLLDKDHFDLVLLDYKMPQMDGFETFKQLNRRFSALPVIMLTGHGSQHLAIEFMKAGGSDFSEKPVDFDELDIKIRNAIKREKTNRQLLETRIANRALNRKIISLRTLVGGISHEFNNDLFPIMGYAEMAMDDIPPGTMAYKNMEEILKAVRRSMDLIKQISTFSLLEKEEAKVIDIVPIMNNAIDRLKKSLAPGIRMIPSMETKSVSILGNENQFVLMINSLCNNALEAMREKGGQLEIGLEEVEIDSKEEALSLDLRLGKYVRIAISDSGKGIDPEIQDRIFDPFFTTKEVGEGKGMGLAVVYGIVESFNGAVTFTSTLNEGSVFYVYLPLSSD
jgi:signal transduction histidine kinase